MQVQILTKTSMIHMVKMDEDIYVKLKEVSIRKYKSNGKMPTLIREMAIEYLRKQGVPFEN